MKLTLLPQNHQSIRGLNTPPAPQGPENQPPQGDQPPGDGFDKQELKIPYGKLALYGLGGVASSAATGAFWAHANQGSAKLELMVNALPVGIAAVAGGLGVGAIAGMVVAKGGGEGTKAFCKWGGGTALGIAGVGLGGPLATQWLVNQLPWSHAVNGAAVGAGLAIVGGAVALGTLAVVAHKYKDEVREFMDSLDKKKASPPQDQQPPTPPQDPKPPQA